MNVEFTVLKDSKADGIVEATSSRLKPTGVQSWSASRIPASAAPTSTTSTQTWRWSTKESVSSSKLALTCLRCALAMSSDRDTVHKTCGKCERCLTDQYCTDHEMYGMHSFDQGSLGTHAVWSSPSSHPGAPYLVVIKRKGTIYPLTVSQDNFSIPSLPLVLGGINIQGLTIAARSVHRRMVDFAARNQIEPMIEKSPMTKQGVEEGMSRLKEGKIRYRAFLVV
ncbi:unnamed protein product [Mycena citricolor]|uniref:Uncharacterized protein n=1 Tax=Mycena citricolor TaxID=2018698 RepID=A0AAD2K605_9AGAR|nr:unnamed protein product [Mycena citricolor]